MEELLSVKLRPKTISDVIGQEHLVGENKVIYNLVKNKNVFKIDENKFLEMIKDFKSQKCNLF